MTTAPRAEDMNDMLDETDERRFPGEAHSARKGDAELFLWRKRAPEGSPRGVALFVHGSSMASQPTFDLEVPGRPWSSAMDYFAAAGFDCWCVDMEGYGRSAKNRGVRATISDGADDLEAADDVIAQVSGPAPLHVYGISSGALRAAAFAERRPHRVARLALDAYVWTGADSPTLAERARKLDFFRANERRPIDRAFVHSIFNRDHPGTAEDRVVDAFADAILALDDSMPTGTYVDMCSRLPVNDPARLTMPTLLMRGQHDGIASMGDLLDFFARLPNPDKQFTVMPGIAHASFQQKNYRLVYDVLREFWTRSKPVYAQNA
ncbi:Lysophospholipase, alpha-beta hydrolase superfamily [Rubrimonas cliftonensis]|uniref:Lysophospholipase, alpha-beta hydrolase superfamily n=2 Tax=Rubrimonas cliftonensis TaxID=89524 RepID=A0A1H4CN98_9RHOB|nr:Lysophospholipase, alpha-beta hydrolase superfamily [Rubrimonas cliftonensis]